MKSRRLNIILGVAFALLAFGAFNTQSAEAGHWRHRGRHHGARVIYRPAYRPVYRPVYPRYRTYDVGVYVGPRYGYGYGGGYNYGYVPAYGYGGGGFCY